MGLPFRLPFWPRKGERTEVHSTTVRGAERTTVYTPHATKFDRRLTYTPYFRSWLRKHPGIILDFMEARKQILSGKGKVRIGNMTVKGISKTGEVSTRIYRVIVGTFKPKILFVKEQWPGSQGKKFKPEWDLAEAQIQALKRAMTAVRRIKTVKVVGYHLAWTEGEKSFLVTDFVRGKLLFDIPIGEAPRYINDRLKKIYDATEGVIADKGPTNIIYDDDTDMLTIIDSRPSSLDKDDIVTRGGL